MFDLRDCKTVVSAGFICIRSGYKRHDPIKLEPKHLETIETLQNIWLFVNTSKKGLLSLSSSFLTKRNLFFYKTKTVFIVNVKLCFETVSL